MRGLFITGTDTGVGKTVVTAAVARLLRAQGRTCRVCKPVATGARLVNGRWLGEDTQRLAEAAGQAGQEAAITRWTFPDPVAPPVAARRAGVRLVLDEIAAAVRENSPPGGRLLVEGVGGLLCPLTDDATIVDLVGALRLPLVVVARRSLGTLNHTLLTLEVARSRCLPVAGVVVNETTPPDELADQTNVAELERRGVPILAVVPFQERGIPDAMAALANVDWWELANPR
jgi:dethiobiotin synthetase